MLRVFGSRISYYTGKLETYLRFRSIDYELLPTVGNEREILAGAGAIQMPVVQLEDGAPGVYEWVARMWNLRETGDAPDLLGKADAPLAALLVEACETHLAQIRANGLAYGRGLARYDQEIQGCRYTRVPTSRYRVWCLEELRREWRELDDGARRDLRELLPEPQAAVLWDESPPATSGYDPDHRAPFHRAINVFATGVPR